MLERFELKKPIKIDGEEKTEISYDFDALTGEDVHRATTELQSAGVMISTLEFDTNYHAAIFAKAAGISYEDMKRFSAKDYTRASALARNFFLADMAE